MPRCRSVRLLAGCVLLLLAACSRPGAPGAQQSRAAAAPASASSSDPIPDQTPALSQPSRPAPASDGALAASLRAELDAGAPGLRQLNITTSHGHVVLRGAAGDTAARVRAGRIVRATPGVVAVENDLSVQPAPIP